MASRTSRNLTIAVLIIPALIFSATSALSGPLTLSSSHRGGGEDTVLLSGDEMMELGDHDGAIRFYKREFSRYPDSAGTANALGFVYLETKDWTKARKWFETAMRLDPTMAVACNNLGSALYRQGKWKESGKMFHKAVKLDPAYAKAWMNLASSYYRRKRYFKAMKYLVKAKSINRAYVETRALSGGAGRELETAGGRGNPFLAYAAEVVKNKKEELSAMKAVDVIKRVDSTYAGFKNASGRIQRTTSQVILPTLPEEKIQIIKGSFFVVWPEQLLRIEYFEPIERVMLVNSSGTWLLDPAEKTAQVLKSPEVSRASMDILLSLNPLNELKEGFDIKRIADYGGSIIIEAKPVKPKKLLRILVNVDPKTWLVKALELFDLKGELLSQTKYENVREFKTLFFPTEFVTRLKLNKQLIIERTILSRVKLNKGQKVSFSVPDEYTKAAYGE